MQEAIKAVFNLKEYKVIKFTFSEPTRESDGFSIGFAPSGKFTENKTDFTINLGFTASLDKTVEDDEQEILTAEIQAIFEFSEPIEFKNIPDYFFRNSLGILFPYLRAFVSTLTFQANLNPPMILPILNLTQLESTFKGNIELTK